MLDWKSWEAPDGVLRGQDTPGQSRKVPDGSGGLLEVLGATEIHMNKIDNGSKTKP